MFIAFVRFSPLGHGIMQKSIWEFTHKEILATKHSKSAAQKHTKGFI